MESSGGYYFDGKYEPGYSSTVTREYPRDIVITNEPRVVAYNAVVPIPGYNDRQGVYDFLEESFTTVGDETVQRVPEHYIQQGSFSYNTEPRYNIVEGSYRYNYEVIEQRLGALVSEYVVP